jgi:hypothetical protein
MKIHRAVALVALAILTGPALAKPKPPELSKPAAALTAVGARFSYNYHISHMATVRFDEKWSGTDDDLKNLALLDDTVMVFLTGQKVADALLPHLHKMPNLKSLFIYESIVSEKQLTFIAALKMDALHLTIPTDRPIKLNNFPNLRRITIQGVNANAIELDGFPALENLEIYADSKRKDKAVALCLVDIPKLKYLLLNGINPDRVPLATFPDLEHLTLSSGIIPPDSIKQLATLKKLTTIAFSFTDNDDMALTALADSHLTHLEVGHVSDEALLMIKDLSRLKNLSVCGPKITARGLARLAECTKLQRLLIEGTKPNAATLNIISKLPDLQWLYLRGTPITPADIKPLANLPKLHSLHLEETAVDDTIIPHLAAIESLREIHLHKTRITNASIPLLEKMTSLSSLYLHETAVTPEGIATLKKSLPKTTIYH